VSKWERGENAPDIVLLAPLAKLLGVTVDWLLGASDEDRDVFEATVLASGIPSAREKSETMAPREFAAWTNGVCYQVTEAVLRYDGVPIKYIGPGILCFFSGAHHRDRALRAALAARRAVGAPVKMGLSTGEVFFGAIGHPDYTQPDIMGEAVSIALLAADWAADERPGGIVAAEGTVTELEEPFPTGAIHKTRFPGISHPVALHEIQAEG
jgi:class 3 adenylate cyclase